MVVVLSYDGPSVSKSQASRLEFRSFFTFPRLTLGRFPRLKIGWLQGWASRKLPADRLSAPVRGLITVSVVTWWCRKTNSGRMMLWWAHMWLHECML